ncbi:MAG TPA: hypothetical protein VFT22_37660 [Kofleriaceae bacterium]|nr:hypothetical protein [Kofleriaceae bacterium]
MRRRVGLLLALVLALVLAVALAAPVIARAEPDLRLPPGTRKDAQGQLVSGRGLRDTSDFLTRELDRRGIAVRRIGPYGVRGALVTRFVSQTPRTAWLAIHVLWIGGKTLIFFVPRPKEPTTP